MELKYLVVLSVLGVAAGFTVPTPEQKAPEPRDIPSPVDLEASFPQDSLDVNVDPSTDLSRDKRGLLFKKFKKHGQSDTVYVNRHRYESAGDVGYRREVHHHHHYPNEQPSYQPYPAPSSHDYHHYHGYQQQQQGHYYSGGSTQQNYYGNGGYAHYGGYSASAPAPAQPPAQQQTPINAAPLSSGHNNVDRGQGAAAVNNIAIIHARAGSSTHNYATSESRILPQPLPIDVGDYMNN